MQRFVLSLVCLCAVFATATLFAADPAAPPATVPAPPSAEPQLNDEEPLVVSLPTDRQEQIRKQLRQTCKLEFRDKPLKEVIDAISKDWGINAFLDENSLSADSIATDTPISFKATGVKRRSALNMLLEPHKLGYHIENEVLVIATDTKCKDILFTRVYNVREHVLTQDGSADFIPLLDLIKETIAPESWTDAGGAGSIRDLETVDLSVVVIRQTEAIHEKVLTLLNEMRQMRRATSVYQARSRVLGVNPLERSLSRNVSVNWTAKPLRTALGELATSMGVVAKWDEVLQHTAGKTDQPVTLKLEQVEAATVLSTIKALTAIDFVFTDDSLLMIPTNKATDFVEYRWYDLADLINRGANPDPKLAEPLMEMIRQQIEPESWGAEKKTLGSLKLVQAGGVHLLAVRQTQSTHRKIDTLLRELRAARQPLIPMKPLTKAAKPKDGVQLPVGPGGPMTRIPAFK